MNTISPDLKIEAGIMPFVTFPLTKKCNFKCQYCGHGGELSASMVEKQDINTIYKKIIEAHKLGAPSKFGASYMVPCYHVVQEVRIR